MENNQTPPARLVGKRVQVQNLKVDNPSRRQATRALCPRCHGVLRTDCDLSEKEMTTVLVCFDCGLAYDLVPIYVTV